MTRLTSRLAAAGILTLAVVLAPCLATAIPASAATSAPTHVAASAVTASPASASPARTDLAHLSASGATVSPAIEQESCTSGRATWVHVDTSYGLLCFGFAGTAKWSVPPLLYTFCAGNNYGYFETYNEANGKYFVQHFTQGFGADFGSLILLVYVEIQGYSGSDKC
jgi:hypothetical protein